MDISLLPRYSAECATSAGGHCDVRLWPIRSLHQQPQLGRLTVIGLRLLVRPLSTHTGHFELLAVQLPKLLKRSITTAIEIVGQILKINALLALL